MLILKLILLYQKILYILRTQFFSFIFKTKFKKVGLGSKFEIYGKVYFDENITIDDNVKIIVEKGASLIIGKNTFIGENVYIKCYGGKIEIGSNVSINSKSFLNGAGDLYIGNNTRIGTQSIMISSNHNFKNSNILMREQGITRKGIYVGENIWFGARVTVLDNVNILDDTVIGAGAVVSKSITEKGVYVGVPAKKRENGL
ncbi:acyltransferase [Acinetobacter sp. FL]|uniref:acyltransferase n=1 Tax=Acinetobacter sp. FL TaxID=3231720 RepID=UPI00345BE50E